MIIPVSIIISSIVIIIVIVIQGLSDRAAVECYRLPEVDDFMGKFQSWQAYYVTRQIIPRCQLCIVL